MCLFSFNLLATLWAALRGERQQANKPHHKRPQATCQPASLAGATLAKGKRPLLGRWFESKTESWFDQDREQSGGKAQSWPDTTSEQVGEEGAEAGRELVPLVGVREWPSQPRGQFYASNLLNNYSGSRHFIGKSTSERSTTTGAAPTETRRQTTQQQRQHQHQQQQDKTKPAQAAHEFSGGKQLLGLVSDDERAGAVMMRASMDRASESSQEPFNIRTSGRRHLDFDEPFELGDVRAPQRSPWSGPFHFIQAADCQFGMIDSYVHHRTEPGWAEEIELCEQLVDLCNRQQPRPLFIIICGDLVDSLPKSEIGRRQVVDFKRIFARLHPQIPLVCVCGNHDVGDEPTPQTVADYRETFGDDYFYFTKNDILFIVINSQFYQNRQQVAQEALEQDQWLERVLSKCRLFKYSIVFEHIPWFLEQPDEDNDYFNIRKEVRLTWLRKFKDAGVTKIMCGHYHRNAGGWFEGMELVVTSAIGAQCGNDKSGVRIVKVFEDAIEHQYYAMADIPLNVELKRTTNSTSGPPATSNQQANTNENGNGRA